jgi:hypothetical protein
MDMPMSDIPPPKPVPAGDYLALVVGHAEPGTATTGTPYVTITFQLLEALESVNKEDLRAALTKPDGTVMPLSDKTVQTRLYLTDGAAYRNSVFLKNLGIDGARSINEAVQEVPGRQTIITLTHRANRSGEGVFAEVSGTALVS